MNYPFKFPLICFGLQLVIVVTIYNLFPNIYPGDTFTIGVFYVFNLIISLVIFPLYYRWIGGKIDNRISFIISNLLCILAILNLLPLATEHIFYSAKLVKSMFIPHRMLLASIIDFTNPLISFVVTSILLRKINTMESA